MRTDGSTTFRIPMCACPRRTYVFFKSSAHTHARTRACTWGVFFRNIAKYLLRMRMQVPWPVQVRNFNRYLHNVVEYLAKNKKWTALLEKKNMSWADRKQHRNRPWDTNTASELCPRPERPKRAGHNSSAVFASHVFLFLMRFVFFNGVHSDGGGIAFVDFKLKLDVCKFLFIRSKGAHKIMSFEEKIRNHWEWLDSRIQ